MKTFGFGLLFLLSSCASMKMSYEEYGKKFADSKKEFTVAKNYQKIFSDTALAMETCEKKNMYGNDFNVYSHLSANAGYGEISFSGSNIFTPEKRWGWMRIYKANDKTKVVIYAAADRVASRMEQFAKGELNGECLKK